MAVMTLDQFHDRLGVMIRTGALSKALAAGAAELGIEMDNIAKTRYLTGPRPGTLGVVTGDLRRSVMWSTKTTGSGLRIFLEAGGGPAAVSYARAHELGNPPHLRARPYLKPARSAGIKMAPRIFTKHVGGAIRKGVSGP